MVKGHQKEQLDRIMEKAKPGIISQIKAYFID
jgi:hypothetical protein